MRGKYVCWIVWIVVGVVSVSFKNLNWGSSFLIFIPFNPISRIYIANYLEKLSLFLFKTVSEEDLNKLYEKRDKYELLEESGGAAY